MKANVYVTLKPGVFDPQGKAVGQTLGKLGYEGIRGVRIGKYVEIEMEDEDLECAKSKVVAMCDELIANSVIENYRVEIDEDGMK